MYVYLKPPHPGQGHTQTHLRKACGKYIVQWELPGQEIIKSLLQGLLIYFPFKKLKVLTSSIYFMEFY